MLRRFRFRNRLLIKRLLIPLSLVLLSVFFCEYLVFVIYITRCEWPSNAPGDFQLRSLALSDTHLFGLKRGHFIDKLKREWQMHMAFKLTIQIFSPNSVFFLGDIFDEGLIANEKEFKAYSSRFYELFPAVHNLDLVVSTGNHDVGFHDRMVYFDSILRGRFEKTFNSSLIDYRTINGLNVINVNSMAMDDDNCDLCNYANHLVNKLSDKLFEKCKTSKDYDPVKLCMEQRPILLSHFPMFRKSDLDCNETDSNYNPDEKVNIRPKIGCLSRRSTNFLLKKLQPKLALNGHTHYACTRSHTIKLAGINNQLTINEYTLSSFNWRNRPNPGFLLLLANANEFRVSRCVLPNENHLFLIYFLTIFYIVYRFLRNRPLYLRIF